MPRYCALLVLVLASCCLAQTPSEVLAQANTKLAENNLNGAWDVVNQGVLRNPENPELIALGGHIDYLRGEFANAELEFKKAIRLNERYAQAWLGLGKVFEASSLRAKAKICYQKAFREDPNDPAVGANYSRTLPPAERLAGMERYEASAPDIDADRKDSLDRQIAELKWSAERKPFELTPVDHAEIKLSWLMGADSRDVHGFALPISFNGGKTLHLLMDTGASGVLLNRKAAEAAGLTKISDRTFSGIGDEGDRAGETRLADTIRIGNVLFSNCPVGVTEKRFFVDQDGIIGPDVFSRFLITIDFQKMVLKLDPLPPGKSGATGEWQDRESPPEFTSYSPFWRAGHFILLPVRVNNARPVLFLIDTGAATSMIDPDYARQFTGIRGEDLITIKGISGKVKKVQSAGFLTFEFAHYRQPVPGLVAIPLTRSSRNSPRMTGIFGITTLANFRLEIDYRDGLINLEYVGPKY